MGGDNLQFFPNFALFSTLGGMKLDHDSFQESKLSEDQKKKLFSPKYRWGPKEKKDFHQEQNTFFSKFRWRPNKKKGLYQERNTFFSPISSGDLHSESHQNQIIGADADEDHTQIIGGDTAKLLGGIYPPIPPPPPPPGFGTLAVKFGKPDYGYWSSHSAISGPTKSSCFENFWWRHCMWFVVCSHSQLTSWPRLCLGCCVFEESLFWNLF